MRIRVSTPRHASRKSLPREPPQLQGPLLVVGTGSSSADSSQSKRLTAPMACAALTQHSVALTEEMHGAGSSEP